MKIDPKIHLAVDNCFAIKRWTTPSEWVRVIQEELGLNYVEGVADLEMEPFLMDNLYREEWVDEVANLQVKTGIDVVMLYSGNSTYDTTGMAHPDERVRNHIVENWFKRFMETAVKLDASVGYFVHAFPEYILFDKKLYDQAYINMMDSIVKLNTMAKDMGIKHMALEQMYTPNQVPFTIKGMKKVMQDTLRRSGNALYLTEDVGHHCPYYIRPTADTIRKAYKRFLEDEYVEIWLGSKEAYNMFINAIPVNSNISDKDIEKILIDVCQNEHLFGEQRDTSTYEWLKELGCYSPVIHLQQTDGTHSSHKGFSEKNNKTGIIEPLKILEAIKESYNKPVGENMPEMCEDIYLTFELYASTKDIGYQVLYDYKKTVEYWRKYIPKDGMRLSELLTQ